MMRQYTSRPQDYPYDNNSNNMEWAPTPANATHSSAPNSSTYGNYYASNPSPASTSSPIQINRTVAITVEVSPSGSYRDSPYGEESNRKYPIETTCYSSEAYADPIASEQQYQYEQYQYQQPPPVYSSTNVNPYDQPYGYGYQEPSQEPNAAAQLPEEQQQDPYQESYYNHYTTANSTQSTSTLSHHQHPRTSPSSYRPHPTRRRWSAASSTGSPGEPYPSSSNTRGRIPATDPSTSERRMHMNSMRRTS